MSSQPDPLASFQLNDHLDHRWTQELVRFPFSCSDDSTLSIRDENGDLHPCQRTEIAGEAQLAFVVDELPPLGNRRFDVVPASNPTDNAPSHQEDGDSIILSNGNVRVRVPAAGTFSGRTFPAPILGIARGDGDFLGEGRLSLSPALLPFTLESTCAASGPLWLEWKLRYRCEGGERYTVGLKLYADRPYIEVSEHSELCRDSHWQFSCQAGLNPNRSWTHPHQVAIHDPARVCELSPSPHESTTNLGAVQLPVYSGIWVPNDYYYFGYFNDQGADAVVIGGVNGGIWDYPYENQIDGNIDNSGDAWFEASIKAGHRRWLMFVVPKEELLKEPFYDGVVHRAIKQYETPLDKVKDYVLDWDELDAAERPFLVADETQLAHARHVAETYQPLTDYVAALDPDLPGDYTYYHSGTHRTFEPDYQNDPAVLYITAATAEERRKQAAFLKDVVVEGLASRRTYMLATGGHAGGNSSSINVGRGLRPWAALYDFAAAEGVFSEAEQKLCKATFALYCYKIDDPDFWPADQLLKRDDHPKSAHRTHWFPGRQSDWSMYNIDNIPHNFHGDLWSAAGCVALTFPQHPESRKWVETTMTYWEDELTQWIFPEGAWLESATYTLNSMKDYLIYCRALANAKIRDYYNDPRLQSVFRYIVETLLPYDERIGGCTIPVLGDASYPNGFAYVIGWMAGLAKADPEYAGMLNAAWKSTGEYLTEPGRFGLNLFDFLFLAPELPTRPLPKSVSKHYPGMGVMLRHAAGTPEDIFMFFKGGVIYSHFHEPEGTFQLWWHGKPICDEFGVQYGEGTSEQRNHNCIEVHGGATCCYNKGDITDFRSLEAFDFTVVDAPILQAYLAEGEGIWGFKGEMGPAGWHRRIALFIKPCYLVLYDDLECAHPTTYHLSIKADDATQTGNQIHYDGRLGVDLEFMMLNMGDREIEHGEFDVGATSKYNFQPPPKFFHQLQLHVASEPHADYATVLVPHTPEQRVSLSETKHGATIEIDDATDRVFLFPKRQVISTETVEYHGEAGVIRREPNRLTLIQAKGSRIAVPGEFGITGDGPFSAELEGEHLRIESDGVGRWLHVDGRSFQNAECDGVAIELESSAGKQTVYLPGGKHVLVLS